MKQYIKYLCLSIIMPIAIIVPLVLQVWYIYSKSVDFKVDESKHLVVFGNSMGACSINDSILCDFQNGCAHGLSLIMEKNVILAYLEQNTQVDTVFISLGEFTYSLARYNGADEEEKIDLPRFKNFANHIAFLGKDVFMYYRPANIVCSFISVLYLNIHQKPAFGYTGLRTKNILRFNDDKICGTIAWYNKNYPVNIDSLSFGESMEEKEKLQMALNEIIAYCHATNRTVVLYHSPTYHINNWIDDTNYNKYLLTLSNDVLIADYSDFEFPDDYQYRIDVQHLNHKGAEYFCEYIKKNGWHLETPQQYYNRRS